MGVIFFEKPGCMGNAKQKTLLDLYNIRYKTEDILSYPWTKEFLEEFFKDIPKEKIYNPSTCRVNAREPNPH
ncbi:MAG: hypothetical protein P8Y16_08505 [Sulfurimonas sp.]